jgi:pyridoxine 5-phosphate synthase
LVHAPSLAKSNFTTPCGYPMVICPRRDRQVLLKMPRLGVNIDHVATLRQARKGVLPEPVLAALLCESAGAESIVAHLREDRRHIQDRDVFLLKKAVNTKFNLEMSISKEIVDIACRIRPCQATFVPEKREELTTEGGLDVYGNQEAVKRALKKLKGRGIEVSLFIDPEKKQINAARNIGAKIIELHTGRFAEAIRKIDKDRSLKELKKAAAYAIDAGFTVNAGHGLDYTNVTAVAAIKGISELNIGYSIICRSIMVGLTQAVREMDSLIK